MIEGKWRTWTRDLVYRRPYEDAWGALHDPRTSWDELLKSYKSPRFILVVGEGTRRMARPASTCAEEAIRDEKRRRQQARARISQLEATDLESVSRQKQWKRRRRKKIEARKTAVGKAVATNSA